MPLFSGLDAFFYSLTQPFENPLIRRAANIHRYEMVLIETCLAEQFLEQLLLCFRLARANDDQGIGVVFSRAEDVLHDLVSSHPAKLRMHNGVVHIEVGLDFEGKRVHVRVFERRGQAFAIADDRLDSHGEQPALRFRSKSLCENSASRS